MKKQTTVEKKATVEKKQPKKVVVDKATVDREAKKAKDGDKKKPKKTNDADAKNPQLNDPVLVKNIVGSLAQSSMLLKVRVSAWRGTSSDKQWAEFLAGQTGGNVDGFSVMLKIMPPAQRNELNHRIGNLTSIFTRNSIPWVDGWRLMPTKLYEPLKASVEKAKIDLRDYVDELAKQRDSLIVPYAKQTLGKAYNDERVPSADQIRNAFDVKTEFGKPDVPDTFTEVSKDSMQEIQKEMREEFARRYLSGTMDLVNSLRDTVDILIEELETDSDRDKFGTIYKMIETRVKSILRMEMFPSKRINAALDQLCDKVLEPLQKAKTSLKKDKDAKKKILDAAKKVKKDVLDDVSV